MVLGLTELANFSKWNNKTATHIDTVKQLQISEKSSFLKEIYNEDNNFNIIEIDNIDLLDVFITSDSCIVYKNAADWTKFFSKTKIKNLYYYCNPYSLYSLEGSEVLLNGLNIETLIIDSNSIPEYKYELECFDDYDEFEDDNDFKKWFKKELSTDKQKIIKDFIQKILDSNQIKNLFVKDCRSGLAYEINGEGYYGVFDLKEYLML